MTDIDNAGKLLSDYIKALKTFHKCDIPVNVTTKELNIWLEENTVGLYIWDTYTYAGQRQVLFENKEDLASFKLTFY